MDMKGGYVDGYVLVVPKGKLKQYKKMAEEGKRIWMKCGALDYKECVGEDMEPNMGGAKLLAFPKMARAKAGDAVVFSYILYKSKAHRNSVNRKVMKEMEKQMAKHKDEPMPWDMKKFAYGGFKVIVGS
jgi:uncharacterized protein YbaA (DUF1428 family)